MVQEIRKFIWRWPLSPSSCLDQGLPTYFRVYILINQPLLWHFTNLQSILIICVLFCKVSVNTEWVINRNFAPWGNTELGPYKPLVTIFSLANQSLTLFYVYFCLTLYWIYSWFINIELVANSTITHVWIIYAYILHNVHHKLLTLRNNRQYFSTMFKCHVKQQSQQKSEKHRERILIDSTRAETRRQHCLVHP